jgi:hypothetical protein
MIDIEVTPNPLMAGSTKNSNATSRCPC